MPVSKTKPGRARSAIAYIEDVRLEGTPDMYRRGVEFVPLRGEAFRKAFLKEVAEGCYTTANGYTICQQKVLNEMATLLVNGPPSKWFGFLNRYIEKVSHLHHVSNDDCHEFLGSYLECLLAWVCWEIFPNEPWLKRVFDEV